MTDPRADDLGTQPTIPLFTTTESARPPVDTGSLPRPRIRFGAIAWGLLVCALAAATFWIATDDSRRNAFGNWITGLTPGTFGLLVMLIIGGLLLLWGGLAAIRRSQERGAAPRI
jgi:hypothetical protein